MVLTRVRPGYQVLSAIFHIAKRPAKVAGEPGDAQFLRMQHTFIAKAAADIGGNYAHLCVVDAQHLGKPGADHMRHLGRGKNHQLVGPLIPVGEDRLALKRIHHLARKLITALDHHRCRSLLLLEIDIGRKRDKQVVIPVLVHTCGGVARLERVCKDRQFLQVKRDFFTQIFGQGAAAGDAHRNGLSDESYLAKGKRGLSRGLIAGEGGVGNDVGGANHVLAYEDGILVAGGLVDGADACMCEGTAQECHFA